MKNALLSAVWLYPDPYKINSPPNDLLDVQQTLGARGYSCRLQQNPLRADILNGLQVLVSNAYSPDKIVWFFAGHGSWATDTSGDEADHRDEVICPVDVFSGGAILDDEIRAILNGLRPGVSCEFILDSCNSGTGSREADWREHYIPGPVAVSKPKSYVPVSGLNHVLWAACKDKETSWEGQVTLPDGRKVIRGLFTYYLMRCVREHPTWTRAAMISWVQGKAAGLQTPQLECTSTRANQVPF